MSQFTEGWCPSFEAIVFRVGGEVSLRGYTRRRPLKNPGATPKKILSSHMPRVEPVRPRGRNYKIPRLLLAARGPREGTECKA